MHWIKCYFMNCRITREGSHFGKHAGDVNNQLEAANLINFWISPLNMCSSPHIDNDVSFQFGRTNLIPLFMIFSQFILV